MTFERVKVGSIANFHNNKRKPVTKTDRVPGHIPYYGAAGIQDFVADYIFDGHFVLVGEDGTVLQPSGKPTLQNIKGKSWVNNHAHVLSSNDTDDTDFLFYSLGNEDITAFVTGAVQMKLNMGNLKDVEIYWPTEKRSRSQVVQVLRQFDEMIDLNSRISSQLEQIARTIFKSWFVDFDPVHAKARGEQPEGMDVETAALFPDSFEDSELGQIPAGWAVKPLPEISEFLNGLALQKYPAVDGEDNLPVIKIPQLRSGIATGSGEASNTIPSKYVVEDGDILFSWSGALEVVLWAGGKGALNQHLFKVIPKKFPKWFSLHATLIHLPEFREIAASKATTMGHIQRGHLAGALCVIPNEELLDIASIVLQPLLDASVARRAENRALVALRDSLLPRLISGEIQIPEELLGE